jgi:threonine dehydratase
MAARPTVEEHDGIVVFRDDTFPAGTKGRFIPALFEHADEVVYASSAEGGAQCALACVARKLGKRATIFVPDRAKPHPRQLEARRLGARVIAVKPGYLSVVQARAREYCERSGAVLAPFGMRIPGCIEVIAAEARRINCSPTQVWFAASSGTLGTALRQAWPDAEHHAVQVGHEITEADVAGAIIHVHPKPYRWAAPSSATPFPADPHYEAKAWQVCQAERAPTGVCLFWNVMKPPEP